MTTKTRRHKVWIKFDEFETGDDPVVYFSKQPRTRPMVERLPGDVVLSREDVKRAEELLDKALNFAAKCDRRWGLSENDLRDLLRGGR